MNYFEKHVKQFKKAKAKKAEADGIAYYNAKVAQNMAVQQQQWKHEEQLQGRYDKKRLWTRMERFGLISVIAM